MNAEARSFNVLVAALGGEGGGVLSDWLIAAAGREGLPVQSTSIPGVAQRTGATTYYIEIFSKPDESPLRPPILALTPTPADIDLVAASELIEAGRALQNGYVSPRRTTLVASTSRVYAIDERTAMADGRFDGARVVKAADELAKRKIMFDMNAMAQSIGAPVSSVLFGAMLGSAAMPISRAAAEDAIRQSGKSVDLNLRGFAAGFDATAQTAAPAPLPAARLPKTKAEFAAVTGSFPAGAQEVVAHGIERLLDYQGPRYARLFLERLSAIASIGRTSAAADPVLTRETARFLSLWMSYEDVIRVADLKTRRDRLDRVRKEVRAKDGDIVQIVDFLKPGLDEVCSILPPAIAQSVFRFAKRRGWQNRLNVGLHIRSTGVLGFMTLRTLACLRWWRPYSFRYRQEQALIEDWLAAVAAGARVNTEFGLEIAECAQLVKGYGDTHRRGTQNFAAIARALFEPSGRNAAQLAMAVRAARIAALVDPDGDALQKSLTESLAQMNGMALPAAQTMTRQ